MGKFMSIKRGPLATLASKVYLFREAHVQISKSQPQLSLNVKNLQLSNCFFKHQTKSSIYHHIWMDPSSNQHLPLARQWKCNSWIPQNAVPNAGRQRGRMLVSFCWGFKEKVDANAYIKPLDLLDGSINCPTLIRKLFWECSGEKNKAGQQSGYTINLVDL